MGTVSGPSYYTDEQIAIVCHEMIRGIQLAVNEAAPSPNWQVQDPRLKALVIGSVQAIRRGAGPAEIHQLWDDGMQALGYTPGTQRMHGTDNPTHPNVGVDFADMTRDERLKDELTVLITCFMATVQR
jgi:hypothetical protein